MAIARPIPRLAPVTKAYLFLLSVSFFIIGLSLPCSMSRHERYPILQRGRQPALCRSASSAFLFFLFSSGQVSFLFRSSLPFSSGRPSFFFRTSSFFLSGSFPFLFRTAFLFLPNKSLSSSGQVSLSLQDGPFLPLPGRKTSESDGPLLFEPHAASPNPSASFCHAALLSHLRTESPCSATGSNADRSCGDSSPAVRSPGISACRRGMPVPEYAHRRKDVASRVRAIPQCRDNRPPEPGP